MPCCCSSETSQSSVVEAVCLLLASLTFAVYMWLLTDCCTAAVLQASEAESLLVNTTALVTQQLQLPAKSCAVITNGHVLWVFDPREPDNPPPGKPRVHNPQHTLMSGSSRHCTGQIGTTQKWMDAVSTVAGVAVQLVAPSVAHI